MKISIIIRTYNEQRYLKDLLSSIRQQKINNNEVEIVIVDSGSTDKTLEIANKYACKITHINKAEFTFGRSLNAGCEFSGGDILVFISGHCIPVDDSWLIMLVQPIIDNKVMYSYGRQVGAQNTKYSEQQVFEKYYPMISKIPQTHIFTNNANSAIHRTVWDKYKFCEKLTGLEDMHLSKRIIEDGLSVGYVSDASVYHIHHEAWGQIRNRYEREAIALQEIMPEVHLSFKDFLHYLTTAIRNDFISAKKDGVLLKNLHSILMYRTMQFWGTYKGNHEHRVLSQKAKYKYFYPSKKVNLHE